MALDPASIRCAAELSLKALPSLPIVGPGDDLAHLLASSLEGAGITLQAGDVLVVTSKVVSRAEGRFVDLSTVTPGEKALELAQQTGKDPRQIELILGESTEVSRVGPGALVTRHRLGFVTADAGIDGSNAAPKITPEGSGPWCLLLPEDPDASARRLRDALDPTGSTGVVISDSFGRPFRLGTVGVAIGVAGLPPLHDRRGQPDLFGRKLERTITALADQVAAAADLVAGQAAEGRAAVHVRGLSFPAGEHAATELYRAPGQDLYA